MMGWALVEVLMMGVRKMPFTCTYFPGNSRVGTLWPFYLTGFITYAYTTAAWEATFLYRPVNVLTLPRHPRGRDRVSHDPPPFRSSEPLTGLRFQEEDPRPCSRASTSARDSPRGQCARHRGDRETALVPARCRREEECRVPPRWPARAVRPVATAQIDVASTGFQPRSCHPVSVGQTLRRAAASATPARRRTRRQRRPDWKSDPSPSNAG